MQSLSPIIWWISIGLLGERLLDIHGDVLYAE